MSAERSERIPELTLGWRLKMALGSMKRSEMAAYLGYDEGTLSRWMNDKGAPPRRATILQWADLTKVSSEWLETGKGQPSGPDPGERNDDRKADIARLAAKKRARHARVMVNDPYPLAA